MSAFVTDQFRILNASSFVDSISDNSYYAFLGLSNPSDPSTAFGRLSDWNSSTTNNPVDNFQYLSHYRDTSLFGRRITTENARRVIRKVEWTANNQYDMYRHDYRQGNIASVSKALKLYDANYYVITSDFKVYVCIENGTSGASTTVPRSTLEPTHTDVEPVSYADGYRWKYLFKVSPSDVIKFDSTEFIVVPNNWATTSDSDIAIVRDGGNSDNNNNQIKTVYIENGGAGYSNGTHSILGDGTGGEVNITVNSTGSITGVTVTQGGKNYTYGIVDLSTNSGSGSILIPIIPPSKGHGYDIYTELGTDKVLLYARFDDSTKDFPIDTKFAQVGVIKNPESFSGSQTFTGDTFSSLYAVGLTSSITITPGTEISQDQGNNVVAKGYVASFDTETKVLKYYQDRSLCFGNKFNQTQSLDTKNIVAFNNSAPITYSGGSGTIDTTLDGSVITINTKQINLGVTFTDGLANPEINKKTGDIIYIDNRPEVQRDSRQKEDVKIILEF